jgi:uncharacterized membrane protein YciS (DUF1049 family)
MVRRVSWIDDVNWLARLFWAVLAIILFFLAALAVNQEPVALHFLNWQTPRWSVFWWLLAAFGLGLLLGLCGITVLTTRLSLKNRKLSRQLGHAEQELHKVRNLTLQD